MVKQIQNDVGVTERGIPNQKISAENRSKYGTTLTGFAKNYIANAINISARVKQTSKQDQADTGARIRRFIKSTWTKTKSWKLSKKLEGNQKNTRFPSSSIQTMITVLSNSN